MFAQILLAAGLTVGMPASPETGLVAADAHRDNAVVRVAQVDRAGPRGEQDLASTHQFFCDNLCK